MIPFPTFLFIGIELEIFNRGGEPPRRFADRLIRSIGGVDFPSFFDTPDFARTSTFPLST